MGKETVTIWLTHFGSEATSTAAGLYFISGHTLGFIRGWREIVSRLWLLMPCFSCHVAMQLIRFSDVRLFSGFIFIFPRQDDIYRFTLMPISTRHEWFQNTAASITGNAASMMTFTAVDFLFCSRHSLHTVPYIHTNGFTAFETTPTHWRLRHGRPLSPLI